MNYDTHIANEEELKAINKRAENSLISNLGIVYTYVSAQRVEATMPVDERTIQPVGILHGGASLVLAETLAGMGSRMGSAEDDLPLGIQVSGNHVKAVKAGNSVKAIAKALSRGSKIHVWSVDILTMDDKLVSNVKVTNCIVKKR